MHWKNGLEKCIGNALIITIFFNHSQTLEGTTNQVISDHINALFEIITIVTLAKSKISNHQINAILFD